ncbi:MAG TPA: Crp/Fnr family transcriptional regulator [Geminicoccaceae bacterium]
MAANATIDKRSLLANLPLFGKLAPEELDRLVAYMRLVRYPARTVLFRKGDPGSNMMVVVRGRVKVCSHSEDGKELVLNLINPGEVVGEIALLDGADRTADAVTLTDTELLVLERRDFVPFLQRHPDACMRLFAVLCERLRRTSELLEEALFLEGSSRLAKRLAHLAEVFGKPVPGGVRIDIPLSQQQLGSMVGMSRESMNKQLKQWRQEGLIRVEEGRYILTDLEALRDI